MSVLLAAIGGVSTIVLVLAFCRLSAGTSLLDIPNERSSHSIPRIRGAGISFVLSFMAVLPAASFLHSASGIQPEISAVLLPLVFLGFLDDLSRIRPSIKLAVHIITAACMVCFLPLPPALPVWLSASASVLVIVVFINFYNFMDGIDGLVASCTAVQLIFIASILHQSWPLIPAAGLIAFLLFNWAPAKVFMGDCGSTFLGAVSAFSILSAKDLTQIITLIAITLPVTGDAAYTLARRLLRGENIAQAHRSHIYQRLVQSGWSHSKVSLVYIAATVVIGMVVIVFFPP